MTVAYTPGGQAAVRLLLRLSGGLANLAFGLFAIGASANPCPTGVPWPTEQWPSPVAAVATQRAAQIKALEDYAFTLTGEDSDRLGLRTDSLLIIHRGELVYEKYARGWNSTQRHISWSVNKSVTSALTGVAVAEGALQIDDSICKYVKPSRDEACRITVRPRAVAK